MTIRELIHAELEQLSEAKLQELYVFIRYWLHTETSSNQLDNRSKVVIMRIPTHREPTHPGEMLLEEFLVPLRLTQKELSKAIHVPYQRINEIINKKRGITPSTALRLARFFGVSEDFWLNLQPIKPLALYQKPT